MCGTPTVTAILTCSLGLLSMPSAMDTRLWSAPYVGKLSP